MSSEGSVANRSLSRAIPRPHKPTVDVSAETFHAIASGVSAETCCDTAGNACGDRLAGAGDRNGAGILADVS